MPGWAASARVELLAGVGGGSGRDHHTGGGASGTVVLDPFAAPASFVSRYLHAGRGEALRLIIWPRVALKSVSGSSFGAPTHSHGHSHGGHAAEAARAHGMPAGGGAPPATETLFGDGGSVTRHVAIEASDGAASGVRNTPAAVLRGVLHGPLLLAALTDGERTLRLPLSLRRAGGGGDSGGEGVAGGDEDGGVPLGAWLQPVPHAARSQLATLQLAPGDGEAELLPSTGTGTGTGGGGTSAAARAVGRVATDAAAAAATGAEHAADCPWDAAAGGATPSLVLSYRSGGSGSGVGNGVGLAARPTQPPALLGRRGGSDAVNAATWRIAPLAAGEDASTGGLPTAAVAAEDGTVVLEAFDRPGFLLTLGPPPQPSAAPSARPLLLLPARASGRDPLQRWRLRPMPPPSRGQTGGGCRAADHFALESAAADGVWVRRAPQAPGGAPSLDAAAASPSSSSFVASRATFALRPPLAIYPPLAH